MTEENEIVGYKYEITEKTCEKQKAYYRLTNEYNTLGNYRFGYLCAYCEKKHIEQDVITFVSVDIGA